MSFKRTLSIHTALVSILASATLGAPAALAQSDTGKDLAVALNELADSADLEILYAPGLVDSVTVGDLPQSGGAADKLAALLEGTGLSFQETSPNVFVVNRVGAQPESGATPSPQAVPVQATESLVADPVSTTTPDSRLEGEFTPIIEAGQPGVIQGTILDSTSGKALAGAIVYLDGTDLRASTDRRGEYRFSAVPPGQYQARVDYLGSEQQTFAVEVSSGELARHDVSLDYRLDTVVVLGNRSSLQQALNIQRAADNSATVIAADLLGSFPAENVSEALRRVSGVTFERDDVTGEGARVNVRGFNSNFVNIQLNGQALQGTGIGRDIDLTGIQGDNISLITIQKTLLPSSEATGSGGQVEIQTKTGLDYGKKYFSIAVEREMNEESIFGDESEIAATAAYKFTDDFGVTATVQYRDTDRLSFNTDFIGTSAPVLPAGFTSIFFLPERFDFPFDEGLDQPLLSGANYFATNRDSTNLTGSLNFAWDVADHTTLLLDMQRIEQEQAVSGRRTSLSYFTAGRDVPIPELNDEVRRRRVLTALRPTLGINELQTDQTTTVLSFRGDTSLGAWDFDYQLGFSETINERQTDSVTFLSDADFDILPLIDPATLVTNPDDDVAMTPQVVGGAVVTVGDSIPVLSLTQAGRDLINDPSRYFALFATRGQSRNPTESYNGKFSTRYNFSSSFLDYLEGGVKYETTERANSDDVLSNTNISSSQTYFRIFGRNTFLDDFEGGGLDSFSLGVIGGGQNSVPLLSTGSASVFIDQIDALLVDDPATAENEERFRLTDRRGADPIVTSGAVSPSTTTEDRFAAYVQSKATIGKFDFIGGVRYEQLESNGRNISTPSIRTDGGGFEPRSTFIDAGLIQFTDVSGTQDTLTPTLIVNYRPNEQSVVRFGYFRSTLNPDLRALSRPSQVFLDLRTVRNTATIREANPGLDPQIIDNFDLDLSYYFKDNPGVVRLAVFYKQVSDNFTNVLLADDAVEGGLQDRILDILAPLAADRPDLVAVNADTQYFLNRPTNGEGGTILGVELDATRQLDFFPDTWPEYLSNFSVSGNLTWTESDFPTNVPARDDANLPITLVINRPNAGQSEWAGNASVSYEQGGFSGRLLYTFQSESVGVFDEFNLNTVTPDFDTLDIRVSYKLYRDWGRTEFYFEGDNLLTSADTADIRSGIGSALGEGSPDFFFPRSVQFNGGRTFTFGIRATF